MMTSPTTNPVISNSTLMMLEVIFPLSFGVFHYLEYLIFLSQIWNFWFEFAHANPSNYPILLSFYLLSDFFSENHQF